MTTWSPIAFLILYDAAALWVLSPRIDIFSGGYLLLTTLLAILQTTVYQRFSGSEEIRQVFYARHLDSLWDKFVPVLGIAELAVYFEYSHQAAPLRFMQAVGLLLLILAVVWLLWVDRYLVENFAPNFRAKTLMTGGPYRYIRHPRYAGLLATRLALPLLFDGIAACLLAVAWIWLIRRRVCLEETFLLANFHDDYSRYARHTPGLLSPRPATPGSL